MNMNESIFTNTDTYDNDVNRELLLSLNNYNIADILLRVSALNLLPYNQNKSIVFDHIINDILTHDVGSFKSENYLSMSKFKNLISQYHHSEISMTIDPAEMPFVQRVQFFGDYWICQGINTDVGFNLQKFINVLFKNHNDINKEYIKKCYRMIRTILKITDSVVRDLGYGLNTLNHYERTEVDIPSSQKLSELSELLVVEVEALTRLLQEDADVLFYNHDNYSAFSKYESTTNFLFFYSPFLKVTDDKAIILNPTMLPSFLVYYILKTAIEFDVFHEIVDAYNNEIWKDCGKYLKRLGHYRIDAEAEGVELTNNDSYKESVYTAANSRLLFVNFFCDNGQDFECIDMFELFHFVSEPYETRWKYIKDCFDKCIPENIYSLSIINTFGRGMSVGFSDEQCKKSMLLTPFELECVSINESEHAHFLPRYLDSKLRIQQIPASFGDLDSIAQYVSNDYSFYIGDHINYSETILVPGLGDAVDYLNAALKKEDRQLLPFPQSHHLKEIVLSNKKRNIYHTLHQSKREYVVRFSNVDIWVCGCIPKSVGMLNMVNSILDLVTFWFGELKSTIESLTFYSESIAILIDIGEDVNEFFTEEPKNDIHLLDCLSFEQKNDILAIHWTPLAFQYLASTDNSREKELIVLLLTQLSANYHGNLSFNEIDKSFSPPLKKKMITFNIRNSPYLKPTYSDDRIIPVEYENELLDTIGQFAFGIKKMPYGIVSDKNKAPLCSDIVSYLYEMLKEKVACLDGNRLCKLCYLDLENVISSIMTLQKRCSNDIACYPEEESKIFKSFNDNNRASLAMKFLLEYVAATQPTGKEYFGEIDYENLLTICSFIIEWAYNKDLFDNKIINSKVEILKSQRIGIDKTQIHHITNCQQQAHNKRLIAHSNPNIDTFTPNFYAEYIPEIDVAFLDEYGYSFTQLFILIQALLNEGDNIESEIKVMKSDDVIARVEQTTSLTCETIKKIIFDISLAKRDDYIIPPNGFTSSDIWPWRFNRRLSFTRRPIIAYGNDLIWGNRHLSHSLWFTLDLLFDGKYRASGQALKSLIGKIANKRGKTFNDDVKKKLDGISSITAHPKVKKINGKRIASDDNNTLGDIDVLIINHRKSRIIVCEVKDFSYTKNAYEMYQEYQKVFCDNGPKLCYISKHKRRVQWVSEHIDDIVQHYNLPQKKWTVRDILITNEVIISNAVYHVNQKILLYSEINEKQLMKI